MARQGFSDASGQGYDPDEIVTRAEDQNGHSANLRVHVPKPWHSLIHELVQSDAWPEYTSVHRFVRDAIYHRLHWTTQQKNREQIPGIREMIIRNKHERKLQRRIDEEQEWRAFKERIDDVLGEQIRKENWESVKEWLTEFQEDVHDIPEPYRSRIQDVLDFWWARLNARW